jgi:glucan phosphoethanolaminetransferase (alkaline phosphatase superfamily)
MKTIYSLFAVAAALWLFGLAACGIALLCCCFPERRRSWLAVVLSVMAILIGYLGTAHFHVNYSRTVNNSHWSIDSRWFFIVPLVLGPLSLGLAIWRRSK